MPRSVNPLKLNPLQLKTLAILQALAKEPAFADPPDAEGTVRIRALPHAHGDHFHIGSAVVLAADATGLANPHVYNVLARKGLILAGPAGEPVLTPEGLAYATGIAHQIFHEAGR
jgi:ribosomal protein S19E (S16A)